jgi:hypothetical protein
MGREFEMENQIKIDISSNYLRELVKKHLKATFNLDVELSSIQFHYNYVNYEFESMDKVEIILSFKEYQKLLNIESKPVF